MNKLCDRLNSTHENIQFTVEVEQHGRLPVMDVLLNREENGEIKVTIYRKPTHTDRYLPFSSHHPISMKESVMKSLMHRLNYVSEGATFEREMEVEHITGVLSRKLEEEKFRVGGEVPNGEGEIESVNVSAVC